MKTVDPRILPSILLALVSLSLVAVSCGQARKSVLSGYGEPEETVVSTELGDCLVRVVNPLVDDGTVWIFFHGSGGSAELFSKFAIPLVDSSAVGRPVLVSFSFGANWYLTDKTDLRPVSGLAVYKDRILPAIRAAVGSERKMVGIGYSMGGFNLLSVYLDDPEAFSALAFVSPALMSVNPGSSPGEIEAYARRTKAYTFKQYLVSFLGRPIDKNVRTILANRETVSRSADEWARIDPLGRLASKSEGLPRIPVLVTCGSKDEFGLMEGSEALAAGFSRIGGVSVFRGNGGHEQIPFARIREFLATLTVPAK